MRPSRQTSSASGPEAQWLSGAGRRRPSGRPIHDLSPTTLASPMWAEYPIAAVPLRGCVPACSSSVRGSAARAVEPQDVHLPRASSASRCSSSRRWIKRRLAGVGTRELGFPELDDRRAGQPDSIIVWQCLGGATIAGIAWRDLAPLAVLVRRPATTISDPRALSPCWCCLAFTVIASGVLVAVHDQASPDLHLGDAAGRVVPMVLLPSGASTSTQPNSTPVAGLPAWLRSQPDQSP